MYVYEATETDAYRWDEYVHQNPSSTPQHLFAWKQVMEDIFHSEMHYLVAEDHEMITGILPLIHVKSLVFGSYITSIPGGMCADNDKAAMALIKQAKAFVREWKSRFLILRDSRQKWDLPGLVTDEQHVTCMVEIPSDLEQLKMSLKKRTRQLIRKVSDDLLTAIPGLEKLEQYYPVYAQAMQNLGTPTMGLGFFQKMARNLPSVSDLITLYSGDEVVGGGFISPFRSTVYCLWSGLPQQYYYLHTSYFLSWEAIRYAFDHGYRWVDLGRCRKDSGSYNFKQNFGGRPIQLYQQFYMNGSHQPPKVGAERVEDWQYRAFTSLWRKLPLQVVETLGPILRRQVPFG